MNPDLARLVHLQATENQLRQAELALQDVPRERSRIEDELEQERKQLAATREKLTLAQQRRRHNETALQDLETRRSKYKAQLMEVKTNKEYQAMLHEIESVEREIRGVEDRILEDMEAAEGLATEIATEERRFKDAERESGSALGELERRLGVLEQERAELVGKRDAVAAELPSELVELFRRVAKLRGVAVAEARDARCQECHVVLRPQMFMDLKHNDQIVQCASCSRILHYAGAVAASADALP